GNGKYEGQLGALIVERKDGRRFKLGINAVNSILESHSLMPCDYNA
ncbi:hypothetical protein ACTXGQ_24070, partial [Marinobacter sp. 1Y8]